MNQANLKRVGRATTADLELDPSTSHRNFLLNYTRRHHQHHNPTRHDLEGCDPLRRSSHLRHLCHRLSSHSDHASGWLEQGTSHYVPSDSISSETISSSNRARLTGNERLPGAVLLARARLLERLRGVSFSGNRQSGSVSFDIRNREHTFVDAGNWGTDIPSGICLESFKERDKLICLPCEHRFHFACLDPWVRTCGDCPYCRRDIVVSSHKM
uniref:RING-type domain-containing protein n=1 Tax=Manihot esculenta TaxID=3983 RepID=A0A2C9V5F0_MANES